MAQYNPPSQNLPIFDSGSFGGTNSNPGSVPSGDFLNFPNAQGDENLLGITVADSATFNADSTFNDVVEINNDTTFSTNIIMSGTYLTNYIEFPDGSQQFTADTGGGSGDAQLSGGTSTTPQVFTGYNEFSNADGQITLTNTTNTTPTVVNISCAPGDIQLNVEGNLSIGNDNNTNTVIMSAAASYLNQLDIQDSSITIAGAGKQIKLAGYGDTTSGIYGLQVSGGGILVGSNAGFTTASTYVQIACDNANDDRLIVSGDLEITGDLSSSTFSGLLTLTNTNGDGTITYTSSLQQSGSDDETIVVNGDLQLSGGTTNRSIFLNYTGQTNLEISQNYDENLEVYSGITIAPNKYAYPSNTNRVNLYADATNNNQLDVDGAIQTNGQLKITGTGAGITFTNGSIQTVAYTGGAPILATYTSSALDTLLTPFVWSFTGISNTLGNQVSWILYSNSAITTNSSSTVFSNTNATITPSNLNNYIYGSGTAIQIPYKFDNGTTTTNQKTYYPSVVVALGGFTLNAIGNTSGTTTFTVTLNSSSNTNFTNASTLKLVFYAG